MSLSSRTRGVADAQTAAPLLERGRRALRTAALYLFFFNALLDRLAVYYWGMAVFTNLFYIVLSIGVALELTHMARSGTAKPQAFIAAVFLVLALVGGFIYGDTLASVYAIKQFFLGVVLLLLFANSRTPLPPALITCLLGVQLYAVFQGVYVWTHGLSLPPWDMAYIRSQLESWHARNLYQGDLIRPFATFGSFSEYQIVVHVLTVALFLLRWRLSDRERRLTWLLVAAMLVVDVLLPDRTPILMVVIVLGTTWIGENLFRALRSRPERVLVVPALAVLLVVAFAAIPPLLLGSDNEAMRRLGEGFRFWEAETVKERSATVWDQARVAIRTHPEGMGPAAVVTALYPDAFVPHSNYFLFAIAYSIAFPAVFLLFLCVAFRGVFGAITSRDIRRVRVGFCGWGVTLAFLGSSFFNAPFSGYAGGAYFLVMLWFQTLLDEAGAAATLRISAPARPVISH
jgi:hypothetical protein